MTKFTAYWQISVEKNGRSVRLTFIDEKIADDARRALRHKGFTILDVSPPFKIERTVDNALDTARAACE